MTDSKDKHSEELLYALYKKHKGSQTAFLADPECPFKGMATYQKYVKKYKFKERIELEYADLNKISQNSAMLNAEMLTKLKDGIIVKMLTIANAADINDPRNVYGLKAAWEVLRTELNLPTTISQNANLNIDAYANKRSIEEIDKDIDDFLRSAEDASPKPATGS